MCCESRLLLGAPKVIREENKLLERRILRKILGPTQGEDLLSDPDIIGEIKAARLRWLGHVERMREDREVKRAYLGRPIGQRPVGRPRYRFSDEVQKDLQSLGADCWWDLARDRKAWRHLVSEAKIHFGSLRRSNKVRTKIELENLVSEPNIIEEIKAARLRWLGHVERMGEDRAVKRAHLGRPIGRWPVGRPRFRWSDEVQKNLQSLGADCWRDLARDRRAWRNLVSVAKIHFGLLRRRV
ncbi:unnamed protein product [Chilo suppressalis]|uniref:Endonuclease-reverse transcriptase n=1 Tax=Chilo suppressalis TaxID=168631 RepID=A0ABN8AWL8_CHISP|nr:unnamed protein product [Chilo suppressalis]